MVGVFWGCATTTPAFRFYPAPSSFDENVTTTQPRRRASRLTMSTLLDGVEPPQVFHKARWREQVGGEFDLTIRSPDPVGAVRLLLNLELSACVVPAAKYYHQKLKQAAAPASTAVTSTTATPAAGAAAAAAAAAATTFFDINTAIIVIIVRGDRRIR
jgi:hypothetical protein